jgi:DNA-binding MarR family transcriptional regulator
LLLCAEYCTRDLVGALQPLGLSFGDFDVLNTLRRRGEAQGSKPSDLAASSLITTGAMTARLDRLERTGLIRRTPDPEDGRGVRVRLTARGHRLAEQALQAVIAADKEFLQPLDPSERDQVAQALKRLLLPYEAD